MMLIKLVSMMGVIFGMFHVLFFAGQRWRSKLRALCCKCHKINAGYLFYADSCTVLEQLRDAALLQEPADAGDIFVAAREISQNVVWVHISKRKTKQENFCEQRGKPRMHFMNLRHCSRIAYSSKPNLMFKRQFLS